MAWPLLPWKNTWPRANHPSRVRKNPIAPKVSTRRLMATRKARPRPSQGKISSQATFRTVPPSVSNMAESP